MSGTINLHRDAFNHPLLRDGEKFRAWFWMVAKACWKPTKFDVGGKTITLERGQFCCSVRELAEAFGWTKSTVDRFIQRLVQENMLISTREKNGTRSGTGRSIITICNYDKYQNPLNVRGTACGTKLGQQRDIKEKGKKEPNGSLVTPQPPIRDSDWIEIPNWMPVTAWNGWLEMRREKNVWPTAEAVSIAIRKLTDWRAKGHDPGEILDNSTLNRWTGIFEPKVRHNGKSEQADRRFAPGSSKPFDNRDGFQRALDEKLFGTGPDGASPPPGADGRRNPGESGGDCALSLANPSGGDGRTLGEMPAHDVHPAPQVG